MGLSRKKSFSPNESSSGEVRMVATSSIPSSSHSSPSSRPVPTSTAAISDTHPMQPHPLSHHHPYNTRPHNNPNPRHSNALHHPLRLQAQDSSSNRRRSHNNSHHKNPEPSRRSQANIAVASSARHGVMESTETTVQHKLDPSISLPLPSSPASAAILIPEPIITGGTKASSSFKFFKYFVFCYMLLVLGMEMGWAAYSTQGLKKDLQMYVESGEWEQTYVREFFKSTKNFFMFNLILIFLSICIGLAAVGTENRHLILAFVFVFGMEWFFEIIGVYNSKEKNVVIYRMIPALLRPGLFVSTLIFYRTVSKLQNQIADEMEKEEAGRPPSPPPGIRVIGHESKQRQGYTNPVATQQIQEEEKGELPVQEKMGRESGNNNESPTTTTTTDENPENEDVEEEAETASSGRGSSTHEDKNVIRISVE